MGLSNRLQEKRNAFWGSHAQEVVSRRTCGRGRQIRSVCTRICYGRAYRFQEPAADQRRFVATRGLDAWCDDSGLSVLTKMGQPIKVGAFFRSSQSDVVNLGHGFTFRTTSGYSGPVAAYLPKTVTLQELNSIELGFGAPISIDQLRRECGMWQALLAFCTRKPSYQHEIRFSLVGDGTKGFPTS